MRSPMLVEAHHRMGGMLDRRRGLPTSGLPEQFRINPHGCFVVIDSDPLVRTVDPLKVRRRESKRQEAEDVWAQIGEEAVRCSSDSLVMLAGLGHALAATQDRKAARQVASSLERLRGDKGLFAYELGVIRAALGEGDQAFAWFDRAVTERSGWIAYLQVDPRLDELHGDPRFARLRR